MGKTLLILLIFMLFVISFSGCKQKARMELLSGVDLQADFVYNNPPDFIWKNEQFPIKVSITNKGDALMPNRAKIMLTGDFASNDFESDKAARLIDKKIEKNQSIEFSLGNATFIGEMPNRTKIIQASFKLCTPYESEFDLGGDYLASQKNFLEDQEHYLQGKGMQFGYQKDWKNTCYAVLNQHSSYCERVEDKNWTSFCYALLNRNSSYCRSVEDKSWRDYCYAFLNQDSNYCNDLECNGKPACYAVATQNISYCKNLGDDFLKYKCFCDTVNAINYRLVCKESIDTDSFDYCNAILTNSSTYCNKIKDKEIKNFCFNFVVEKTHDYHLCDKIKDDPFLFDICKMNVSYKDVCDTGDKIVEYIQHKTNETAQKLRILDEEIQILNEKIEDIAHFEDSVQTTKGPIQITEKNISYVNKSISFLIKNVRGGFIGSNCEKNGKVLVKTSNLVCPKIDKGIVMLENGEKMLHCKIKDADNANISINLKYEYQQEYKKDILLINKEKKPFSSVNLIADFVYNNPPDFIWKNEEFPIKVSITNKGDVLMPNRAKIMLTGDLASDDFKSDKAARLIDKRIGKEQSIEFSLGNATFIGEMPNRTKIIQASFKLCTHYESEFDYYFLGAELEANFIPSPVEAIVNNFNHSNKSISFLIKNVKWGFVGSDCEKNEKVLVKTSNLVCPKIDKGIVMLENGEKMLHCKIKDLNAAYVSLNLEYWYGQEFEKATMIKDRKFFPFD